MHFFKIKPDIWCGIPLVQFANTELWCFYFHLCLKAFISETEREKPFKNAVHSKSLYVEFKFVLFKSLRYYGFFQRCIFALLFCTPIFQVHR